MRLATFTVFPQMSYWGFLAPITPATTGPMLRPGKGNVQKKTLTNCILTHYSYPMYEFEWTMALLSIPQLTYFHLEVVKRVFVDVFHLVHHPHGVVGQSTDVWTPGLVIRGVIEAWGRHVGGANGLYLLQLSELILADDLVAEKGLNTFYF